MKFIGHCPKCINWFSIQTFLPFITINPKEQFCKYCGSKLELKRW
ncbi:hypothetical protein EV06_0677 [Prochlorococcus sp. MIT 0602]|nr:hypothetical protein EV06_0677 [Prochlorococcus sp. MIT 0602]KGG18193.1 hypothetical protein EV07_0107 [Prochlorococcus sp. MIT 0603]